MEKKKQKKLINKIKAKKIVKDMDVRMVKVNQYNIRKDLSDEEYMDALKDFMILNNRQWIKERKDGYSEDATYGDIVKDFLSIQHLYVKEQTIESFEMKNPELWELVENLDSK